MSRSVFRLASIVAIAVCSAAAAVRDIASRAYDRVAAFAVNVVTAFEVESCLHPGQEAPEAKQSMGLVEGEAFKRRMDGRNRPTVTPRWRMCPSA